jgi:hypothetical protein
LGTTKAFLEGRTKKQINLSNKQRGLAKWNFYIKPILPIPIEGSSILDLGCNSGLFSLHCLQQGAKLAVGYYWSIKELETTKVPIIIARRYERSQAISTADEKIFFHPFEVLESTK